MIDARDLINLTAYPIDQIGRQRDDLIDRVRAQLADDGCLILLNNKFLKVFKNFELILHGYRNQSDGLWDIPLPQNNRSQEKTTERLRLRHCTVRYCTDNSKSVIFYFLLKKSL